MADLHPPISSKASDWSSHVFSPILAVTIKVLQRFCFCKNSVWKSQKLSCLAPYVNFFFALWVVVFFLSSLLKHIGLHVWCLMSVDMWVVLTCEQVKQEMRLTLPACIFLLLSFCSRVCLEECLAEVI